MVLFKDKNESPAFAGLFFIFVLWKAAFYF